MPNYALDQIDLTILAALQRDGRLQNVDLADIAGLSSSPCLRRVRRLERAGFILRYSAVVERSKLDSASRHYEYLGRTKPQSADRPAARAIT